MIYTKLHGVLILFVASCASGFYFGSNMSSTDICTPFQTKGIDWILQIRQPDYGWEEQTHRALIALAVNGWLSKQDEIHQMGLRLDVDITKALLRNSSSTDTTNELALYIHALIATNRNPRNFYGYDLVAELLRRVDAMGADVHPFLVLALCNSRVVEVKHLRLIRKYLLHNDIETKRTAEFKSIALKAFACAASLDIGAHPFHQDMEDAADCLKMRQTPDGSFYNLYVTSLAVQAIITCRSSTKWYKDQALDYLRKYSTIDINMISAYLTELALNADRIPFIKDLHPNLSLEPAPQPVSKYYVQYTIRIGNSPDVYFTTSIRVPEGSDFFQIMKMCADANEEYNFSYYLNEENHPIIYEISGTPNDAEENLYWKLCRQRNFNHNGTYLIQEHAYSPMFLVPEKDEHLIYLYSEASCT